MLNAGKAAKRRRFELEKARIEKAISEFGEVVDSKSLLQWEGGLFEGDGAFALLHVCDDIERDSLHNMLLDFDFENTILAFFGEHGRYLIRPLPSLSATNTIGKCMAFLTKTRSQDTVYLGLIDGDGFKYLLSRRPWATNRVIRGIIASHSGDYFFQLEVMFRSK